MKLPAPIHDRDLPGVRDTGPVSAESHDDEPVASRYRGIRRLIWIYFWLLLLEGALRKWVLPQFASPLLVVRDPVVMVMYLIALMQGIFPRNKFITWSAILAIGNIFTSVLAGQDNVLVTLYGLRTAFLHLPLIFLVQKVFTVRDVEKIGKWLLITSVPMAILAVWQFRAAPDAWINSGAGAKFGQISVGFGKIRPPGTFSFTIGLACYAALVVAFLLAQQIGKAKMNLKVAVPAIPATGILIGVSGSRTILSAATLILIGAAYVCFRRPSFLARSVRTSLILGAAFIGLQGWSQFRVGMAVHENRLASGGGVRAGLVMRALDGLIEPIRVIPETPLVGQGIGMGTAVASQLREGERSLAFGEEEWTRIIRESGPVLGLAYVGLRVALVILLFVGANRALLANNPLPILLACASGPLVFNATWGVTTTLGFATFSAGLCLAAMRVPQSSSVATSFEVSPGSVTKPDRKIRGRSIYAEKLHGR